jgi:hypothetical protein
METIINDLMTEISASRKRWSNWPDDLYMSQAKVFEAVGDLSHVIRDHNPLFESGKNAIVTKAIQVMASCYRLAEKLQEKRSNDWFFEDEYR